MYKLSCILDLHPHHIYMDTFFYHITSLRLYLSVSTVPVPTLPCPNYRVLVISLRLITLFHFVLFFCLDRVWGSGAGGRRIHASKHASAFMPFLRQPLFTCTIQRCKTASSRGFLYFFFFLLSFFHFVT